MEVGFLSEHPCNCSSCLDYRQRFVLEANRQERTYGKGVYAKDKVKILPEHRGVGRAWMVPVGNNLIIFNAYGLYQSLHIARLLATILGLSYKKIILDSEPERALYLNGDGFIVGEQSEIATFTKHIFESDWEDEDFYCCDDCGNSVPNGDVCSTPDGRFLCEDCFNDNHFYCYRCGNTYNNDNEFNVNDTSWCERCATNHACYCEVCEEFSLDICEDHHCDECGEDFPDLEEHLQQEHSEDEE